MKKVLLVTWWDPKNFGNRLQAVALKQMIDRMGYETVCMPNTYSMPMNWRIKQVVKYCFGIIGVKNYKYAFLRRKRIKALTSSSYDLLKPMTKLVQNFDIEKCIDPSDYVAAVVGSDQVWHKWTDYSKELELFYLQFMPPEKRISYAASFGFEIFPMQDRDIHISGLNGMHFISCRERSGCELVTKNTNKEAELVLDPTLCVGREYWDKIEWKPSLKNNDNYIFVMLLGNKETYYPFIEKYASKNELKIIDLTDSSNNEIWNMTIGNFIWLVHNAHLICTDSFHCSVFSILYERPLTIFRRVETGFEHMYDRISTLLDMCNLHMCEFNGKEINDALPDYKIAKGEIAPMIEVSNQWLANALNSMRD